MRRTTWLMPLLSCLAWAAPADASSILYNTTDLGNSGYQFQTGADGSTYGVTNKSTGVTYAFDKAPTTAISQAFGGNSTASLAGSPEYSVYTLQDGAYKVGYSVDTNPNDPANKVTGGGYFTYPTFESPTNSWIAGSPEFPMIADMNKLGQVVGSSLIEGKGLYDPGAYYAAFSAPGVQAHGGDASIVDNLNNYIAAQPGMKLQFASSIDDLGQIIASGTNGHDYLLTPIALGEAATVPEPTVLATLGLGGLAWLARPTISTPRRGVKRLWTWKWRLQETPT